MLSSNRINIREPLAAAALLGIAVAGLAGCKADSSAAGPSSKSALFTAEGRVKLPLRFPADATYSSWPGGQRQAYTIAGSNGDVGYTVELPEEVSGGRFELEVLGGATGREDLDVTFYASFSPVVSDGAYTERRLGGEEGTIPPGSRFAIVTMFDGADARFAFRGFPPVGSREGNQPTVALPPPGIHSDFGFQGSGIAALAKRLQSRPHVVIAVVDTGINPYHVAYARPEYAVHPSLYIDGFPKNTPALGLTKADDYATARAADDEPVWSQVDKHRLYWIPGTNIIGVYSVGDYAGTPPGGLPSRLLIDDHGHGTGSSSVAAGAGQSSRHQPFGSNPDALIVSIEGLGDAGVKWAMEQPWIDFISGSYGTIGSLWCPPGSEVVGCGGEELYTAPFVLRDGRTACFAAGNGFSNTGVAPDRSAAVSAQAGPSWVVTVGAVSPRNGQDYWWHSVPVDISSYGSYWPAAAPFTVKGEQSFGGTSNATPVTCGVFSRALLAARNVLGDAVEGVHTGPEGARPAARGRARPGLGMLEDGVLTRQELQDAVFKTAVPTPYDPNTHVYDPVVMPDSPLYYVNEGYGIANVDSALRAIDVILGRQPLPNRAEVDAWIESVDAVRDTFYPPPQY